MSREHRGEGNIFRRGSTWWLRYSVRGRSIRESAHTADEKKARKLLIKRLGQVASGLPFIGPAQERVTFDDLERVVLDDYRANDRRSIKLVSIAFRRLRPTFGDFRAIDITSDRIGAWVTEQLDRGLSHSSINYTLAMLRRAFRLMQRAARITSAPYIALLEADPARQGFVEPADFARLHAALPAYLQDPIAFLYLSGWRVGEMRSLEWRDVNLAQRSIRLRSENSKNGQPRLLKLGGELLAIVERAHAARRLDCGRLFHHDGTAIGDFRKSWQTACTAAALPLRIHDLRRSAVRDMVRAGVPERVAMAVSGHKTRTVFERYNIVSEGDLEVAVDRLDAYVLAHQRDAGKVVAIEQRKAS